MNLHSPTATWHDLTLGQLDFWQEACAHPGQPVSTVAHVTRLRGVIDRPALERAINQMSREAQVLSLRFGHDCNGSPKQVIDPRLTPIVQYCDLRQKTDPQAAATELMRADTEAPIDLTRGPLAAQWLLQTDDQEWHWYFRGHHIFLDGYSMALIERRVARLYDAYISAGDLGREFAHFDTFLAEEHSYRNGSRHVRDRQFWQDYLGDANDLKVLRKGDEDYPQAPHEGHVDLQDLVPALRLCSERTGIGWPELLTLLSGIWLWSCPGEDNRLPRQPMTIWLPFMGRLGSVSATIPAMVVNILPFQVRADAQIPLPDLMTTMARDLRKARRHGRYRIEQMTADRGLDSGYRFFFSPLVNVLPFEPPRFKGCDTTREVLAAGPGDGFNLSFAARNDANELSLLVEADPTLTSKKLFARHLHKFPRFLKLALNSDSASTIEDICRTL
ncbi:condensation domain-containing protein [Paracoccus sp. Z330]|uniref:Condensation domain-containing protein n=1 Tax=Paracoccus onchidii TaxID=3017813 RepID=A0ABT4ZCK5_9RHOB|nr:condensation domain-containing protein [Paracoccus onchidii]MDB6176385.1 condensation domain-containing protein [Paracoccus onchidii]